MRYVVSTLTVLAALYALGGAIDHQYAQAHRMTATATTAPLIHRVDHARTSTWQCQTELGATRTRSSYTERSSPSWLYRRWVARLWESRAALCARARQQLADPVRAIYAVFGANGDEAIRVFRCESNLSTTAENGQYLGLAQMGSYARARYGHSHTALGQARAAYAYYRDAGWHPWECAHIVGVL